MAKERRLFVQYKLFTLYYQNRQLFVSSIRILVNEWLDRKMRYSAGGLADGIV
jgi:hypothetical protein